jgi:hypothetical protein
VARDQVAAFTGEGGHAAVDGDSKSATAALWTREGHEARINWMHGSRGVALTGEGGGVAALWSGQKMSSSREEKILEESGGRFL